MSGATSGPKVDGSRRPASADASPDRRPQILGMAAPLVVSFWLRAAFTMVDMVYATMLEGPDGIADASVAAIGLTQPFEFMMIACWVGSSNGLTARLAAALGARQGEKVEQLKRVTWRIILTLMGLFLALAAGAYLAAEWIAPEGEELMARQFRSYAPMLLAGFAVTAFWSILPDSLVKAHQDTRSTMWAGLISGTTNVVLNSLFVFVFQFGIFGIALATVLARIAGLGYALMRARRHERCRLATGEDNQPGVFDRPIRAILVIAIPAGLGYVLMSVESLSVLAILSQTGQPTESVAAWSIFDRVSRFMAMPVIAISVAMLPLCARLFGRGAQAAIGREIRTAGVVVIAYLLLLVTPLALFLGPMVAQRLADAEQTRVFAELGLMMVPLSVLAMAPFFVFRSTFEGMQMPRPGLMVSVLRTTCLVLPLVYLGVQWAPSWGASPIAGAYAGYLIGTSIASSVLAAWLRRTLRRPETECMEKAEG